MSDEEFTPTWGQEVPPGLYFWSIRIWDVELPKAEMEKPFLNLFFEVIDGAPPEGFKNSFRLYITPNGKRWALWFLRKFGYPEELLGDQPVIRKAALIGLTGKIQAEVTDDAYGFKLDVKGFERLDETELEERIRRKEEVALPQEDEPTIDVNADAGEEDLSFLDREEDGREYTATDSDLPDVFFEPPEKEERHE
jgi:hypothetical protein